MPATATVEPVVEPAVVSKLGDLSAADLIALKQLLGVETPTVVVEQKPRQAFDPEANLPPDKPLDVPVRFWNARYPEEHIRIPGRSRSSQFWAGTFNAKTERELHACRNMGRHVYEGDDLEKPLTCAHPGCGLKSWNSAHYQEHVTTHAR